MDEWAAQGLASPDGPQVGPYVQKAADEIERQCIQIEGSLRILTTILVEKTIGTDVEQARYMRVVEENLDSLMTRRSRAVRTCMEVLRAVQQAGPQLAARPAADRPFWTRPAEALKPMVLTKDTSPVEFSVWQRQFRAYHQASHMELLPNVTQHAYVLSLTDTHLSQLLQARLGPGSTLNRLRG
jgi:hypothetical protein